MSAPKRPWELVLADYFDEGSWDEATELASLLADECYPDVLKGDVVRSLAASAVVDLIADADFRRCLEGLLVKNPTPQENP